MVNTNDDNIIINGILSKREFLKLAEAVKRGGVTDEAEAAKLVRWAIKQRTNTECLNLLLEDFFTVTGWNGDEPLFGMPADALDFTELIDFPMPEVSR